MAEVEGDEWDQQGQVGEGDYEQVDDGEGEDEEVDDLFGESAEVEEPADSLLMKFCPHDSSMLYPQEHRRTRTLRYAPTVPPPEVTQINI